MYIYIYTHAIWYTNHNLLSQFFLRKMASLASSSCSTESVANKELDVKSRSVSVRMAHELLQAGHRYLDVRTSEEFNAGHPPAAVNIPYYNVIKNGGKEMLKNPKFLEEVSSEFGKEEKFIVGCRSGGRSQMAATDLQAAGFTNVIDVTGGYMAWKENGLPSTE
ncbi:thiosulfate sulfurtransferase 16, chloroplastic-like isoform X2 [Durio zibethinus]|uniref:Thiosulfate sulfurtransferase 16, chloroplastic-like isoform X2 n=1 Tax=Durio zibethinus TaxID=66656 RepID=A0A6P6AWW0_DURZI|nr:thiosulfate sulfurtransferase 16, chloroplastic-like isoform X2 [Durio zibethinus]